MMRTLTRIFSVFAFASALALSAHAQGAGFTKLGGEKFDFASQKGKVVVLAIGARWLPLSKNQAATLNKIYAKYDASKVSFYFVMVDTVSGPPIDSSTDAQLEEFAKVNRLAATVLRDPKGTTIIKLFKPDQLPAFVVLDRDGKIVGDAITGLDPKTDNAAILAERIDKAVAGSR